MSQTPPELLAPYKAPLIDAARALLRAADTDGTDGIAIEIPASVPPSVIVLGAQDQVAQLLRTDSREPMLGGRRASDPPVPVLSFDEPEPGTDGPPVVDSPDLVTIRRWLQAASMMKKPVTLSGAAARALCYAMDTGVPMEPRKERG